MNAYQLAMAYYDEARYFASICRMGGDTDGSARYRSDEALDRARSSACRWRHYKRIAALIVRPRDVKVRRVAMAEFMNAVAGVL
jgi:hypothetical protein